ncbi:MAG: choice-of-anchor I family protein [Thermoleophilia bacterium]|jgi:2',3'-cyclic-nucleotide 2'-phosphodiesterase (5'-nucleotidase family)|nr:choice-of-anchor I family protein [Thermoleophilia bacterium]
MPPRFPTRWVAAALAAGAALTPSAFADDAPRVAFSPIGTYDTGLVDRAAIGGDDAVTAAEIAAFERGRLFVVNSTDASLDVVDARNPASPQRITRVRLADLGIAGSPTSVAVRHGLVAVAVAAPVETEPGSVVFLSRSGRFLGRVTVGALPDMLTFTPDGEHILVANEGQPSQDYATDPEGSVSVIRVGWLWGGMDDDHKAVGWWKRNGRMIVRTADFRHFDRPGRLPAGVRIGKPGQRPSQDLEPEYIAVSPDGDRAFVTLQENNAVAEIHIRSAKVRSIRPLGFKDHDLPGNALDASDRDSLVNIANWPVRGLPMPDAIATFRAGGREYHVTANEGDARDYEAFSDEERLRSLPAADLPAGFDVLRDNARLGRLNVVTTEGKGPDGRYRHIYSFGTRSFSVWDAETGMRVADSGDDLEQLAAKVHPGNFNASNNDNAFDSRSDNKGPEPEGATTGRIDGRTYAFVGLERIGGFVAYDVSDPSSPQFVQWANNRDFTKAVTDPASRDLGPEGLQFVSARRSPTGKPLVIVSNEVSGTVTVYEGRAPGEATTLSLLHSNDGESSLLPIVNAPVDPVQPVPAPPSPVRVNVNTGGVAAYKAVTDREIAGARGARNSVLNVYAGDSFLASSVLALSLPPAAPDSPVYDAIAQRQIAYDAHILGNHEFDFGPDFLERYIRAFRQPDGALTQPFLSANLGFGGEPGFADLIDADGLIIGESTAGRVVARSMIHLDPTTGQRFGVVGATTPALPTISSPRNVTVTPDTASTAVAVQAEIDRLRTMYGMRKIVFVSHLQAITNDRELIGRLRGVDVAVAGGGDELLAGADDPLLPGETQPVVGPYPATQADADGRSVPLVTTAGNYKYLGRIDVRFDAAGEVAEVLTGPSGPKRVIPAVQADGVLARFGVTDQVTPDAGITRSVVDPVTAGLAALSTPILNSEVVLNTAQSPGVRDRETNSGNLITDGYLDSYDRYGPERGLPARGPANPVIAIQNGGGIRQNAGNAVPASAPGTISRRNTLDVLAFLTNSMIVVRQVPPADLRRIFERSASALPAPNGRFMQVAGMKVTLDTTQPAQVIDAAGAVTQEGSRVRELRLVNPDGTDGAVIVTGGVVQPGAPNVSVVTNNFTTNNPPIGGDGYPWLFANPDKVGLPATYEQAWVEYMLSLPGQNLGGTVRPTIPASNPDYATGAPARRITILP